MSFNTATEEGFRAVCASLPLNIDLTLTHVEESVEMSVGFSTINEALQLTMDGWRTRLCAEIASRLPASMDCHRRSYKICFDGLPGSVVIGGQSGSVAGQIEPLKRAIKLATLQTSPATLAILGVKVSGRCTEQLVPSDAFKNDTDAWDHYKPIVDYFLSNPEVLVEDDNSAQRDLPSSDCGPDNPEKGRQGRKKLPTISRCISLIQYMCTQLGYHKGAFRYVTSDSCTRLKDYGRDNRKFANGAVICGCHCHLPLEQISVISVSPDRHGAVYTVPSSWRPAANVMDILKRHARECERNLVSQSAQQLTTWLGRSSSSEGGAPPKKRRLDASPISMFQVSLDDYHSLHREAISKQDV